MKYFLKTFFIIFAISNAWAENKRSPSSKPKPLLRQKHNANFESFLNALNSNQIKCEQLEKLTQKDFMFLINENNKNILNKKAPLLNIKTFTSKERFPNDQSCFWSYVVRLIPCLDGVQLESYLDFLTDNVATNFTAIFNAIESNQKNNLKDRLTNDKWSCSDPDNFLVSFQEKSVELDNSILSLTDSDKQSFIRFANNYKHTVSNANAEVVEYLETLKQNLENL
jgi:hypothetical protein